MAQDMPSIIAREYLTVLQKRWYDARGLSLPSFHKLSEQMFLKMIEPSLRSFDPDPNSASDKIRAEQLRSQYIETLKQVPSPYENPTGYWIMAQLADEIEAAAARTNLPIVSKPVLGTLPLGEFNAKTVLIPDATEHLVIFQGGLFNFALLLSKAIARAIPFKTEDDESTTFFFTDDAMRERIEGDSSVAGRFAEVVVAYATTGDPGIAPQYWLEPVYNQLAAAFRQSMELFLLGHEYGHVVAGHLSQQTPSAALISDPDVNAFQFSWNQEYEADRYGVVLSMNAMTNHEPQSNAALSYSGSDLLFSAMDVMDRAISLLNYGDEGFRKLGSHPPSFDRRSKLRTLILERESKEESASIIHFAECNELVVETLWQRTRPILIDFRKRGKRAADIWQM
jgi:hypothetical protein